MKPKVALVRDGFLPAGSENKRGRLSGAAKTRLSELASQGWHIEGYSNAPASKPTTSSPKPTVGESTGVPDVPEPHRNEDTTEAFYRHDGKVITVGMRGVCNLCHSSLTYCACPVPKVWDGQNGEVMVEFRSRTKPISKKWW